MLTVDSPLGRSPQRYTPHRYTPHRYTPQRYTPQRYTPHRYTTAASCCAEWTIRRLWSRTTRMNSFS
ncbi:hypothetical protein Poly41_08870 [Novipirellula artificiosorum]|uniref:Uncharacterized protein n=1 Tax=Novipirellula artificiosorum TaxID=2528016 RepID=A0A5C6E627_9BACT|nr:hypothetical protein Poly41_08870 [Novipirellula artificiosorum]